MNDGPMSSSEPRARSLIAVIVLLLVSAMAGCAHNSPRDPLEPVNRVVYKFNDGLDTMVIKPIATGYRAVLPGFARTGIGNFFSNLEDITVVINGVLQLKFPQAFSDAGRFLINSTVGILGFFDVGTHFGLEKHNEDFGQTLGYWGIGSGPYLVVPIIGPSSFRDAVGRWVDSFSDVVWQEDHIRTRNQFLATRAINDRARLLKSEKVLEAAAIDRYTFIREAYLQRRRNLVYDGNPPPEPEDYDPPAQPRSESERTPETLVVDQFGNIVAGAETVTGGVVPVLVEATSKVPARVEQPAANAGQTSAVAIPAVAAYSPDAVPTSAKEPTRNSTRMVRVWLPSSPLR